MIPLRKRLWPFFWLTLAAFAVVLAGFHAYYANLKPSPYDLRVLGQTEWLPDTEAALHVRVLRHDGGAERGVPVTVELASQAPAADRRVQLASLTTGALGEAVPRFRLPDWPDGPYQLQVTARPRGAAAPETITRAVTLKHSWRLMASTDKPVYQPGQVIHMRGLALRRPDLKPVAGQLMAFSVTDPRGNVVFREGSPTSRFGIASADCPLAGELIEGNYHVDCRVGETTSRATVEVRRYVLPRFKVALTLDQPYYQPGQVIKGRVQADYVFGKPVADGVVNVAIEATDVAPKTLQNARAPDRCPGCGGVRGPVARDAHRPRAGWRSRASRRHGDGARPRRPDPGTDREPRRRRPVDPDRGDPRSRRAGQGSAQHDPPPHHHARRPAGPDAVDRLRPRS